MASHRFPWDKQAIIALFCDPFLADVDREGTPPENTLQEVAAWLQELADSDTAEVGRSAAALREAAQLFVEASEYAVDGRTSFGIASKIDRWCTRVQEKLKSLRDDELFVLPGGWWFNDKKDGSQQVLFVFHCTSADELAVTICNAGSGVFSYHSASVGPGSFPKEKAATSWRLLGISRQRVTDFFWLNAAFSAYFTKKPFHKPELIYEVLVPYILPGGDLRQATDTRSLYYSTVQRSGASSYKSIPPALRAILQARGVGEAERKRLMYELRLQELRKIWKALTPNGLIDLAYSDRMVIECACHQVSLKALREERAGMSADRVEQVRTLITEVEARVAKSKEAQQRIAANEAQGLSAGSPLDNVGYAGFPGWELLCVPWYTQENRYALRHLMGAGSSRKLPSLVDIAALEACTDPSEIVLGTCNVCDALVQESQEVLARLRIGALIEAVFTRQIPPGDLRWRDIAFTKDRQKTVLEHLWRIFQHYMTTVAMVLTPRKQVSAQVLTARCLHWAFEVILRTAASDELLPVTAALRAPEGGELGPMWSAMGEPDIEGLGCAVATEGLPLAAPELAIVRDALQRHDDSMRCLGRTWDHNIREMKVKDVSLRTTQVLVEALTRKVLHIDSSEMPPGINEDWPKWTWAFGWAFDCSGKVATEAPEWCWWRDICMWCKYLRLDKASRRFSGKRSYQPRDATLAWAFGWCDCFKGLVLRPTSLCGEVQFNVMCPCQGAKVERTGADLEAVGLKGRRTEDDVVHAPGLPNFMGALAQEESELFLSALTTPYLRIPLVLHFFAADRLHALKQESLQEVLWSVMFEPGTWVDDSAPPAVSSAPVDSEDMLGCSYGTLHNEVLHGLHASVAPLRSLCQQADELANVAAPNDFSGGAACILLFILRLVVRFHAQLQLSFRIGVMEHSAVTAVAEVEEDLRTFVGSIARKHIMRWICAANQDIEARVHLHAHLVASCAFLDLSVKQNLAILLGSSSYVTAWYAVGMETNLRPELQTVFEVLQRRRVEMINRLQVASATDRQSTLDDLAHVVSNFSAGGVAWEGGVPSGLGETGVSEKMEESIEDSVGPTHLPSNWPSHAPAIFRNMRARFPEVPESDIVNAMVQSGFHGGRAVDLIQKAGHSGQRIGKYMASPTSAKSVSIEARFGEPGLWRCPRPDGAAVYDAQTATLWLESGLLQPIPAGIKRIPDFDDCFRQRLVALSPTSRPLLLARQCHTFAVQDTEEATMELQWWSSCGAAEYLKVEPEDSTGQVYNASKESQGVGALGFPWKDSDACASRKVNGVGRANFEKYPGSIAKWLHLEVGREGLTALWNKTLERAEDPGNGQEEAALALLKGDNWLVQTGRFNDQTLEVSALQLVTVSRRSCWLELRFACQGRPVVRGFTIGEFGRHVYREQIFTSDGDFSYAAFEPNLKPRRGPMLGLQFAGAAVPKPCLESLVVTDDGLRVWVPSRALCGLLPDVLLESYCFWMYASSAGSVVFTGEPLSPLVYNTLSYKLQVYVDFKGVACVERRSKTSKESWLLASPLHAPAGSQIASFMNMLAPLEAASHVLFWVKVDRESVKIISDTETSDGSTAPIALTRDVSGNIRSSFDPAAPNLFSGRSLASSSAAVCPSGGKEVVLVELPRLQMKFQPGPDPFGNGLRLFSKEFQSFYVVDRRSCQNAMEWQELLGDPRGPDIEELLSCMPHAIVLRSTSGALRILASNAEVNRVYVESRPFSTDLVIDRRFLRQLNQRHFIWEVHDSASLLLSSSLSGTLCLCFLLLLARQYARCVRYVQSISFDEEITKDQLRLLKMIFLLTSGDAHPNAYALRLKLVLALAEHNPKHPWLEKIVPKQYAGYVVRFTHVSRACRLLFREEAVLCQCMPPCCIPASLKRRMTFIDAMVGGTKELQIAIENEHPARPHEQYFCKSFHESWPQQVLERTWRENNKVAEAEERSCRDEITQLIDLSRRCDDADWSGAHCIMFTTIYGILRGESSLLLNGRDVSVDFIRLALEKYWLRTMRVESASQDKLTVFRCLWSVLGLRMIGEHENLPTWKELLDLQATSRWGYVRMFDNGKEWMNKVCIVVKQHMQKILNSSGLFREKAMPVSTIRSTGKITIPRDEVEADLLHYIPRMPAILEDFSRGRASVESVSGDVQQMLNMPLEAIANSCVTNVTAPSHVPPNAFTHDWLKVLPAGMTRVATDIIARLESGHSVFMAKSAERQCCSLSLFAEPSLGGLDAALKNLQALEIMVRNVWSADLRGMQRGRREVLSQANEIAHGELDLTKSWLRRCGGLETYVWLEWCIGAELDGSSRGFDGVLRNVNSNIMNPTKVGLEVLELMLQTSRVAHAQLVLGSLQGLRAAAERLHAKGEELDSGKAEELRALAERAAQLLAARRTYTSLEDMQIEPAFLFFEYVTGFLIRQAQVNLIRRFATTANAGDSLVAQMIMGAGKTTCIAPMLTLLLGNHGRLVLNVVPKNLLAQTREVMRKIFGQILAKKVVTLDFSRMMGQEDPFEVTLVRSRLFNAQRDAAVVCTTPAAIKSLFLRHLELLEINALSVEQIRADEKALRGADHVSRQRLQRRIQNLTTQTEGNRAMAASLGEVILMLRNNSCALIDEVDLVLHPLKSELNFPIGDMEMYDLGNDRWHLAVHLLDALFLMNEGHAASGSFYPDIREGHLDEEAEAAEAKAEVDAIHRVEVKKKEAEKAILEAEVAAKAKAKAKSRAGRASSVHERGRAVHGASTARGKAKPKAKARGHSGRRSSRGGGSSPRGGATRDDPEPEAAIAEMPREDPAAKPAEATEEGPKDELEPIELEVKKRGDEISAEVALRISELEVEIPQLVEQGYDSLALQRQPHLVLLSTTFYHSRLRPVLAEWLACWILTHDQAAGLWVAGIGFKEVSAFLAKDLSDVLSMPLKQHLEEAAGAHLRKLLTLGREWLFNLLPHVLSKIDRVQYGLLTEVELASEDNQKAASSRRLLAVPFVGKDKPSPAAEFAQPDVLIGFTILAYRYEGLRISDIMAMLHHLQQKAGRESGPWSARPTCALFEWWKELGQKRLIDKGSKASESDAAVSWELETDGVWKPLRSDLNEQLREAVAGKQTIVRFKAHGGNYYEIDLEQMVQRNVATRKQRRLRVVMSAPAIDHLRLPELQALAVSGGDDEEKRKQAKKKKAEEEAARKKKEESLEEAKEGEDKKDVPKSKMPEEEEQLGHIAVAGELLGLVPEIVLWYLLEMVFDGVLRQQPFKLSATGQELGSSMLFTSRIGFSGTPSSLLPEELGVCMFEAENEGEILSVLSDARHVVPPLIEMDTDWTPLSILERVAFSESPRFHALIDTGALVMGLTNEEVARALLRKLPQNLFDGVVYFDDRDAPMVIVRNARQPILLAEAGVPMDRRFTFFDQVHTTGTDTKQPLQSFAALTVAASMTFRDYAQGAWRMRGLGKGQKLQLLLTPELVKRVQNIIQTAVGSEDPPLLGLDEIVSFLLSNGFESEGRQATALELQNLATIWRRPALDKLMRSKASDRESMRKEVQGFKESLRFPVDDHVREPPGLLDKMRQAKKDHESLMGAAEIEKCNKLIEVASGASGADSGDLGVEITRQQEKEQEKQQEKEKEVQVQVGRERESEVPWPLACLSEPALPSGVFYTLAQFRMSGLPRGAELTCSPSSMISSNHTVNDLLSLSARRLKNVILLLVFSHPAGKRTIAVSLAEAAALRRAAHLNLDDLPPDCALWLRADSQKVPESSHLLMGSGKRSDTAAGLLQARRLDAARQLLRFFNCDLDFKPEEVTVSVGALEAGEVHPPRRQQFIDAVLRARRREACAWRDTSLGEIVRGDGKELEWAQALVVRLHGCMTRVLGLRSAVDVFKMFDASGHGIILFDTFQKELCSKVPGEFSATEIRELFRQADQSDRGHLTYFDMEELLRFGAVAGGEPEPPKISFVPSPRSPRAEDEGKLATAEATAEGTDEKSEKREPSTAKERGDADDEPAVRVMDELGRPCIVKEDSSMRPKPFTKKLEVRMIPVEDGRALISELKMQVNELQGQNQALVAELCSAREKADHNMFIDTLQKLAQLGTAEVPDASEATLILSGHGRAKKMRKDKSAFQLAVLVHLSDDSSYKSDLDRMYASKAAPGHLKSGAANIEKEVMRLRDAWDKFQQLWSQVVLLPAEAASVSELVSFAHSCPKSLIVQLFVLERLYRIETVAVFDVGCKVILPAMFVAIPRHSEKEDGNRFAYRVVQWALSLLVEFVKAAPDDMKKELSKPDFIEVANQVWTTFQHEFEIILLLCHVLGKISLTITRWQFLVDAPSESWQTYEAEQAICIRRAVADGKPAVYFPVDSVPHCVDLTRMVHVNLETDHECQVRELHVDISEPE